MAQADQVAGHVIGGAGIVDPDGHGIGRDAADHRHGQPRLADDVAHEVGLAQRRRQDDARDPLRDQPSIASRVGGRPCSPFSRNNCAARVEASSNTPTSSSLMKAALGLE